MNPSTPDPRDVRIAELERENAGLKDRIRQLEALVAALQGRVAELEAKLGENSRNSSKPPSSDRAEARARRTRTKKSGGRRGGQVGHRRSTRELVPPEKVTRVTDVVPQHCRHCAAGLHGRDKQPQRRQLVDLPPVEPVVYEWRLHALRCSKCGTVTRAAPPPELAHGAFGPRLAATVALLTGRYRLSKRNAVDALKDLTGLELSLGMISKLERRASLSLLAPVAAVAAAIRASPVVNIDETSWTEERRTTWLWSASAPRLAYFQIGDRTRAVAHDILGKEFAGIVVSDRLPSYADRDPTRRQVCWAHLDRTFEGIVERGGRGARFGHAMKNLTRRMWRAWHALQAGERTQASFERFASSLRRKVKARLLEFSRLAIPKVSPLCANLLAIEPALWTFVYNPAVGPTNNAAERALRPGVIYRKTSFGTDSHSGSLFVSRMLSAAETLRRQGRRVFTFLVALLASHRGHPLPSLLPV